MNSPKTKILIASGRLGKGGAERFVSNLLSYLDREKFDIHLCLFNDCIDYPLPQDIKLSILNYSNFISSFNTAIELRKIIKETSPDVVLSAIGLANRITGMALFQYTDKPFWVARIGNHPKKSGRSEWRSWLNFCWDKVIYQITDHFVVNSKGLKDLFNKHHQRSIGRTTIIYNPTDMEGIRNLSKSENTSLKRKADNSLLIHIGRFHRQKRHDVLIDAIAVLNNRNPTNPVELWLCGDGYLKEKIQNKINKLRLENVVRVLGHVENPFPIMKKAEAVILTSDWEGMPNVLVEAMALGVPVVSTDCKTGPNELIQNNITGFLARTGDPFDVADKIESLINCKKIAQVKVEAKRRVEELFDYKVNMSRWEKILNRKN